MVLAECKAGLIEREQAVKEFDRSVADLNEFYRPSVDLTIQWLALDPNQVKSNLFAAVAQEGEG